MTLRDFEIGDERGRGMVGHRQNDRIINAERYGVGSEIERGDPAFQERSDLVGAQFGTEEDLAEPGLVNGCQRRRRGQPAA